jgi:hypothetical protein
LSIDARVTAVLASCRYLLRSHYDALAVSPAICNNSHGMRAAIGPEAAHDRII